jgi:predicted Zn-ribbon and HTH transcriptional regulator
MREASRTTRERIADRLREGALPASALAREFEITTSEALSHVEHIAHSLDGKEGAEQLLVAPPACRDCGFDAFDDLINRPSRCPDCKSENVEEPAFRVE